MSKISNYYEEQKELSLVKLEQTANNAILTKSDFLWLYVLGYAEGLKDAYNSYMDDIAVEQVRTLLNEKQEEYLKEEELN